MISNDKLPDHFVSACLELSDYCSVGCPYCLLEFLSPPGSKETIIKHIECLAKFGIYRYSIGGGEPLEVPYVYDIGEYIRQIGGYSLLRTSASQYIDIERAQKAFDIIDISIDSTNIDVLRKCKPNINHSVPIENIKNLCSSKFPIRCNILLTQYSISNVEDTIKCLAGYGVKNLRLQRLVPRGKAKQIYDDIIISDTIYKKTVFAAKELGISLGLCIEELRTVNSQTLCVVKPDGKVFVGYPKGLLYVGHVEEPASLKVANSLIYKNQMEYYCKNKICL